MVEVVPDKYKIIIELEKKIESRKELVNDGSPLYRKIAALLDVQIKLLKKRLHEINHEKPSFSWGAAPPQDLQDQKS